MYHFLFAVALLAGLTAAQSNVPHATANMSSNAGQVSSGQSYQAECAYNISHPQREGENQDSDWEITVTFHKEIMSMSSPDHYPAVAEFRQNGTNMVFNTVQFIEGLNVWPADGVTTGMQSPKRVIVMPAENSMYSSGQWKCSVTMKLKGTDAKVRFMSKSYYASPGPSQPSY